LAYPGGRAMGAFAHPRTLKIPHKILKFKKNEKSLCFY
jgi:hypothetical protein